MADIKFRVWHDEKLHRVVEINFEGYQDGIRKIKKNTGESIWDCESNEYRLMQYTGLKDKNGVEIYEGDILKVDDDWDKFGMFAGYISEVYYGFGCTRFKPRYDKNSRGKILEDDDTIFMEVIGHIHENPELLDNTVGKKKDENAN
jgi:uncharacterized phage protein (TIGR01671 family)